MICKTLLASALCLLPNLAMADSDPITLEMSKRSHIAVKDIEKAYKNCELNQDTLNLCAFRLAVSAERALDAVQDELALFKPEEYRDLKAKTQSECQGAASASSEGESVRAAEISLCIAGSYRARHAAMVEIQRIEAAPHPPHKWD